MRSASRSSEDDGLVQAAIKRALEWVESVELSPFDMYRIWSDGLGELTQIAEILGPSSSLGRRARDIAFKNFLHGEALAPSLLAEGTLKAAMDLSVSRLATERFDRTTVVSQVELAALNRKQALPWSFANALRFDGDFRDCCMSLVAAYLGAETGCEFGIPLEYALNRAKAACANVRGETLDASSRRNFLLLLTHIIFVASKYGYRALTMQDYGRVFYFLFGALDFARRSEDAELLGEICSSLRCLSRSDQYALRHFDVRLDCATQWLLATQRSDGTWMAGSRLETDREEVGSAYHTVLAVTHALACVVGIRSDGGS